MKFNILTPIVGIALMWAALAAAQADVYTDPYSAAESGQYLKAASLFAPLAQAGDAQAQFNLALMYHGGLGVARDEHEAIKWYELAAKNGIDLAQEFLAVAYEEGWFGLPRDTARAAYWHEKLNNKN